MNRNSVDEYNMAECQYKLSRISFTITMHCINYNLPCRMSFQFFKPFLVTPSMCERSRGSSVSIVTSLQAGRLGFDSRERQKVILSHHRFHTDSGAYTESYLVSTVICFSRIKWPGREADHSSPSIAKVNSVWRCTSTSPYVYMAWYLVKHRDNFTFPILICKTIRIECP
jgi:hypothetical protein